LQLQLWDQQQQPMATPTAMAGGDFSGLLSGRMDLYILDYCPQAPKLVATWALSSCFEGITAREMACTSEKSVVAKYCTSIAAT